MSGNPFRRPQPSRPDESAIDDLHVAVPKSPPKTKNGKPKKRVQIISPPQSPVESPDRPRRLSDGKTGSPPPPPVTVTQEDVAATTATSSADPNLQHALLNTQRNSDGAEPLPSPVPTGMMRAPYNPFARTLATGDAHLGLQRATTEERGNERLAGGPPKMNVDMFKNLLMTGSASPSPPVTQSPHPQRLQESSSGTDTSSVSRQSLFDPAHELHPESPRTSFDQQSISEEEEGDEDDNEHVSLMGPTTSRPEAEGPPPPPKHRHGKPLGLKGPQTVSFADFNESIPAGWQQPSGPRTPPVNSPLQGILRPLTPRSPSSDLNKPLPPPPEAQTVPNANTPTMANEKPTTLPPVPQLEAPQPKKIPPPPPPSSRRQAQNQNQGRSRSGSNLTQNSIQEEDETPKPISKAVPPPPPSRRTYNPPAQSSHAVETPPGTEPSSPISENKPMPPPPRRNTSKSGSSHIRSSSNASSHSIPRLEGGAPPPAPPPRRGAAPVRNNIGEYSHRRSSQQSLASETSSLRQIDEGRNDVATPKEPQRDIMADLAALQAEVDALRAGAGHG